MILKKKMELIGDFEECGESDNGTKYSSIKQLFEKEDLLVDDNRRVWYHNAGLFGLFEWPDFSWVKWLSNFHIQKRNIGKMWRQQRMECLEEILN